MEGKIRGMKRIWFGLRKEYKQNPKETMRKQIYREKSKCFAKEL